MGVRPALRGTARLLVRKQQNQGWVEVGFVLVRLVVSVVTGGAVDELDIWVLDLLINVVDQKPSPPEVN
jgi:hypothetical protein